MPTRPFEISQKSKLLLFALFTSLGLLANHFKLPLFFGVDFIFGSIFSMLALRILGLRWGIFATIIISSYTIRLWHQPYSMWIFVAEVLAVALISKRWKLVYVTSDILYWLFPGLPLVFLLYAGVLSIPPENVFFLWLKLAVNGILNISMMRILFILFITASKKSQISLSELSFDFLTFLILIPALFQVSFHVREEVHNLHLETQEHLASVSNNIVNTLNTWFKIHVDQLEYLATSAKSESVELMQGKMDEALHMGGNFLRIGYMDREATSIAYSPPIDELGNSNIGKNFSERDYFPKLKKRLSPMLSNVMMGKVGRPQPIVALMTPVIRKSDFAGFIGGVLDLKGLETIITNNTKDHFHFLPDVSYNLIDQTGKTIISNRVAQIGTLFQTKEGTITELSKGVFQITPQQKPNTSAVDIWKDTAYVSEKTIGSFDEWRLVLEQSIAPLQQALYNQYKVQLTWIFSFLILTLALIGFFHKKAFESLTQIKDISSTIPKNIESEQQVEWPQTQIMESSELIENFKVMINIITDLFKKIKESNIELDQRVQERTVDLTMLSEELRKSKEEWERSFNAISDIVTIQDIDMRIVKANSVAALFFKTEPENIIGKYCYEIFRGTTEPCPGCPETKTKTDKKSHTGIITHDKLEKIFFINSSAVCNKDNNIEFIVHVAKDITDQKKLEEELFQAHKMEAVGTLAGGIAHDFNNILAAIIGYADMAKTDLPDWAHSKKYIEEVLLAGNRAKELVQQILTFSRKGPETKKPLQLSPIIKEGLKLMRASIPTTIEIKTDIASDCGSIIANPTNIHQVLVNLCTNAFHAIEDEKGVIRVKLAQVLLENKDVVAETQIAAGPFVELMISDTGAGISQQTIDRIFEPYFTTKDVGKGSGMGLALVHGIVQGCGGFIKVETELNKGTTFHVYFPVIEKKAVHVENGQRECIPTGNERVLVVDDEETIVGIYKATLEQLGYTVTALSNSEKTLEVFCASPDEFDLIITDQTMPGLTGSELAKDILQKRPDMPIIMCTGYSSLISEEKAREIGISKFLMKPVERIALAQAVREILDRNKS